MKHDFSIEKLKILRHDLQMLADDESFPSATRDALQKSLSKLDEAVNIFGANTEQLRLAAIYRVSQAIESSLDLDQVLTQVMDAVISLTNAERGFLMLVDTETQGLNLRAARNIEQETLQSEKMEISRTVIESVLKTGQGVVTTDAQTDPRFSGRESVLFYGLRSLMGAPLIVRGKVIGVIYVDNRAQSGMFTRNDLDLLSAFASQAAIAIDNAYLFTRTDQALAARIGELETLTQIDGELNASLDLERVLEITHRRAIQGTDANLAWVFLSDEAGSRLSLAMGPTQSQPNINELLVNVSPMRSQVIPISDNQNNRVIVPLSHVGKLIGALVLESAEQFTDAHVQFLRRLAGRAATAIENARLYQAVQQANLAKSKFVSVVSHELRVPMTSIRGYTDLLRQGVAGKANDQQLEFLEIIRNNVERMSVLVSDLSDISRIETGRLQLETSSLHLKRYVEETVQRLQSRLDEKEQSLTLNIPDNLPTISADPNRLVQVLTNLISNANKYTPSKGSLSVQARVEGNHVRIDVSDTGIGIDSSDQQKLFSQFFRSEDEMVREQQGWGLGLNVTKQLVELMGGSIGLQSKSGLGSNFWFTLPIREVQIE